MNLGFKAAVAALFMMPAASMAASVNIALTAGPADMTQIIIEDSINDLDIILSTIGSGSELTFGAAGVGVYGGGGNQSHARINPGEILRFDFGRAVRDLRINVGAINGAAGRTYTLLSANGAEETLMQTAFDPAAKPAGHGGAFWDALSRADGAPIASLLVTTTAASQAAGFSIKSIYYDTIAPVPLPTAGALLGGGMAALAWLGRRKRRQAV